MLSALLAGDPNVALPRDASGWQPLLKLAAAHRLEPALWVALCAAGRAAPRPTEATAAVAAWLPAGLAAPEALLQRAYEHNVRRDARMWKDGQTTLRYLDEVGIDALPLKGLHTRFASLWADPAVRTMTDIDVLVPADRAEEAQVALRAAGLEDHPEPIGTQADHQLPMLRRGRTTVELHVAVLVSRWDPLLPAADVWSDARPVTATVGTRRLMSTTHAVAHLIAHAQLQDHALVWLGLPLRALHETHVWLTDRGEAIDWDHVARRFAAVGRLGTLQAHLLETRRLFGGPVPDLGIGTRALARAGVVRMGMRSPRFARSWRYAHDLPRSFAEARMSERYGPPGGRWWLWRSRARYAVSRVGARARRGT